MSSSSRSTSPLATRGPRRWLAVSPQSAVNANLAATRAGITQRMLVDALLGDVGLVGRFARRLAGKLAKRVKRGSASSETGKSTHQDRAGRTQANPSDP
ncbi:MAG: hypothetical protein KGL39_32740 [Patescibacteria group bacterium]|nr:hypothetical protein [Patescibacteria group bacterium]